MCRFAVVAEGETIASRGLTGVSSCEGIVSRGNGLVSDGGGIGPCSAASIILHLCMALEKETQTDAANKKYLFGDVFHKKTFQLAVIVMRIL